MKTIYIYMLKNKITGGIYIGQTNDPQRRFWEHKSQVNFDKVANTKIRRAIKEYGKENFEMTILEEVPYESRYEKERYYIDKYDALSDENYNELQGYNVLIDVNTEPIVEDYHKGLSASKIGEKYGVKHPQIITILKKELGEEKYNELSQKHTLTKKDISIETIVDLIENQGKTKKETAQILGVCDSTVVRRYNNWKKEKDSGYVINPHKKGYKTVDEQLIIDTYLKLESTRKTADETGYARSTVQKYLKKNNLL